MTQDIMMRLFSFLFVILFYFLFFIYALERKKIFAEKYRNTNFKWIFNYLILVIILFLFSIKLNITDLIVLLFHPYSFLAFFIACVSLTVNKNTIKDLSKISSTINNFFLFFLLVDFFLIKGAALTNSLFCFVLFECMFFERLTFKRKIYIAILLLLIIIIQSYTDNRGIVLQILGVILGIGIFKIFKILHNRLLKTLLLISGVVILYFISFQFEDTFNYFVSFIKDGKIDVTDTRSFLYLEFFDDFKGIHWFSGKGYLGTYFSQWFYNWEGDDGDSSTRFSLEIALLEILLKGGLLLLLPFLAIIIQALKNGFVKNIVNSISFKFSIFLFVEFVLMGIGNMPYFSVNYMFLWLSIGIIFRDARIS